jgi:RNA polymerase sigma-70 factor (ECF subfamily)
MTAATATLDERRLIAALRDRDEQAFASLLQMYHSALVRMAMSYVRDRQVAEEVAQETWLGVIRGIDRFRGESSLKTWIFRILTNTAKTRAVRENRSIPLSSLGGDADEEAVDPERFFPDGDRWAGHWISSPGSWRELPEEILASREAIARIRAAIDALPPTQQQVISLRDIEGWSSEEVCSLLSISETNQRVLLHRARSKVRRALEELLTES